MALTIFILRLAVYILAFPVFLMNFLGLWSWICKRLFAYLMVTFAMIYNRQMASKKRELFGNLQEFVGPSGKLSLLEVGCGTGANFKFYPSGCRVTVLKPGGAFYFLEHVAAERSTWNSFWQQVLDPLWYLLFDGCNLTRESWKTLERASFSKLKLQHIQAPLSWKLVRPHIYGYAVK
uniref:Methyltransferase like 7A n=1 Tax=Otolemur garnettii TaxID=30611 RepID=H0X0N1_OTOGA